MTCYLEHVSLWNFLGLGKKDVGGGREPGNQVGVAKSLLLTVNNKKISIWKRSNWNVDRGEKQLIKFALP